MIIDDLINAYLVTRKNKRRSSDSIAFELHCERNLLRLLSDINGSTLQPTAYTFVVTRPRPREVFACEMAMRIVHHYLDIRLRPIVEKELTTRTFNNRIGYGTDKAVNTLLSDIYEVSKGFTEDCYIVAADLSGYFPNANQDIVYNQFCDLIGRKYKGNDKDDVYYLLRASVYSYPTNHCYRKSSISKWRLIPKSKSLFSKPNGIGGAIGHLFWQIAMNYYLNDYDHFMIDTCGFHYLRFVDDMRWVTDNKEALLAMFPLFRKMLAEKGCKFNESKFQVQHYTKGGKFIGTPFKLDRVYISKRIVRRLYGLIHRYNKHIKVHNIEKFICAMNSYLGQLKGRNAYSIIRNAIDLINPEWWQFLSYDDHSKKLITMPNFTPYNLIKRKYNVKFSKRYEYKQRRKAKHRLFAAT